MSFIWGMIIGIALCYFVSWLNDWAALSFVKIRKNFYITDVEEYVKGLARTKKNAKRFDEKLEEVVEK